MDTRISNFFDDYNLDIRETGDQRFSDQKVKIDNLRTVSDIIIEVASNGSKNPPLNPTAIQLPINNFS